jgi:hypothetical protein
MSRIIIVILIYHRHKAMDLIALRDEKNMLLNKQFSLSSSFTLLHVKNILLGPSSQTSMHVLPAV